MTLCETCIHYQGGRGVQKGVSLCGKRLQPNYRFPETVFDPHGYVPAKKNCHTTEKPKNAMPKRLDEDFRRMIAHEQGTAKEVAARHGVYYQTVERSRQCYGIFGKRGRKPKPEAIAKAIELRRAGWLIKPIAKEVGHCPATVWNWCEDAGVNPPPKARKRAVEEET